MSHLNGITHMEKCTEGMSAAEVYKCKLGSQTCYLKTIDNIYVCMIYSVKRSGG